jgi:hypothetical protein
MLATETGRSTPSRKGEIMSSPGNERKDICDEGGHHFRITGCVQSDQIVATPPDSQTDGKYLVWHAHEVRGNSAPPNAQALRGTQKNYSQEHARSSLGLGTLFLLIKTLKVRRIIRMA